MMRGAGELLGPHLRLPPLFCVLVNPGVPVATPAVFGWLALRPGQSLDGPGHPDFAELETERSLDGLRAARNDLQPPALALVPAVGDALAALAATDGLHLARMSGSGATVFGLYASSATAASAARRVRKAQPHWWVKATMLR
jgi:4-diphosphocytidyl-2-C-methyl-D-erythritol kinase